MSQNTKLCAIYHLLKYNRSKNYPNYNLACSEGRQCRYLHPHALISSRVGDTNCIVKIGRASLACSLTGAGGCMWA